MTLPAYWQGFLYYLTIYHLLSRPEPRRGYELRTHPGAALVALAGGELFPELVLPLRFLTKAAKNT
jgi:hypothetical protein